ncbi:hypothetical protein [Streptomyces lincolnensis]|uniref:hypothetical protein n=1 Tax=Streptomyces lincolnensis TaxID=1915 RepID=UPI000834892A|nr:hypothetical protein [Streptomyces lincolnensis]QMV11362.1 hypothetical protein GJU35_40585 [Streptomyces lincolnensis]
MPHQPQRTGVGRRRRGIALAASLGVLALATACGGGGDEGKASVNTKPTSVSSAPAAGVVAPAKVEVIAGLIGCTASIRIDADELREGVCQKGKDGYRITTFPEEKYKETWLESASVYGGKYLVGMRWVVSAKPELLEPLRPRIGGTVRELRGIGPSAAPSPS